MRKGIKACDDTNGGRKATRNTELKQKRDATNIALAKPLAGFPPKIPPLITRLVTGSRAARNAFCSDRSRSGTARVLALPSLAPPRHAMPHTAQIPVWRARTGKATVTGRAAGSGWPGSESWVRGESLMRRWGDGAPPYSRATPCLWDVMDRDRTLSLGRDGP